MKVAEHFPIFMEFFNIVPIGTSTPKSRFFSPQNSFRQSSTTKILVFILFFPHFFVSLQMLSAHEGWEAH